MMASIIPRATHRLGDPVSLLFTMLRKRRLVWASGAHGKTISLHASSKPRLTWLMRYRDQGSTE